MTERVRNRSAAAGPAEHGRELQDAVEQSAASREILIALGQSGAAPAAILDAIVDRAARLCRAEAGQLYLVEGDLLRLSRTTGPVSSEFSGYVSDHPLSKNRTSLVGRVAVDRQTQQIPDVLADAEYQRLDLQRLGGYRTVLSAPMVLDDEVVGVLSMWRMKVAPFDERELRLLEELGLQGAIALRQVRLLRALESRGQELASKVAQLEALREVGESVSSTLDLDEVLQTIVNNAVRLTRADGGSVMEYVEPEHAFSVRSACGSSEKLLDRLRGVQIDPDSTLVGRAASERRVLEVVDLGTAPLDPHLQILYDDGWRSVLAAPMLRRDRVMGALVIRRRSPGAFDGDTREVLQTFAGQSALAIQNARLFRELEVSKAELEVASRHKSEFLASMSHELRTPLNAVIGFSEVLLDQLFGELNERQSEYVRDIWSSGRHLLELLNEILDLSKVEAGRMQVEPSTFEVRDALAHAEMFVRKRAQSHDVRLTVTTAGDVGAIETDELRFKQVVVNLLSNAVKFTPDGGAVELEAHRQDGALVVTVTDTGIGVPPEDRERIFESFQQGRRGAPKEEGTGLGLTLSRRIVELLGGRLFMTSEVGVGSTFGFTVPYPDRADHALSLGLGGPRGSTTILLVDDDRASLDLLTAYLASWPVEVRRAEDGRQALEAIRQDPPDAVVLDIRLPGMDGWELLQTMKKAEATSDIPVLLVTVVDERARGLALGASAYLTKPVTREAFVAALGDAGVLVPAERAGQMP